VQVSGAYNASVPLNAAGEYDVRVELEGVLIGTAVGAAAVYTLRVAPGPASAAASLLEGAGLAGTMVRPLHLRPSRCCPNTPFPS
jgi:hypothetical protein